MSQQNTTIVLIHPPAINKKFVSTKFIPYGMAVLYSFLTKNSIKTVQQDFLNDYLYENDCNVDYCWEDKRFSEEDFNKIIRGKIARNPLRHYYEYFGNKIYKDALIYGFSIQSFPQYWASLILSAFIKSNHKESIIVFGGPFITVSRHESFTKYDLVDYWVRGSGEYPLLSLAKAYLSQNLKEIQNTAGIIYKHDGKIIENGVADLSAEDEEIPNFDGLDLNKYRYDHALMGRNSLFLPYRFSKGCSGRCSFCAGRLVDSYSTKSTNKIVSELKSLSEKYNTNYFQFADAAINSNLERIFEICDQLSRHLPQIRWYSYIKISGCSKNLLERLKKAGAFALFWGVEVMHQPTIDLIKKNFDANMVYTLIDHACKLGLRSKIHLIYNLPHESAEDSHKLIALMKRYSTNPLVSFLHMKFMLVANSEFFRNPNYFGLKNIKLIPAPLFERELYNFEEIEELNSEQIEKRNQGFFVELKPYFDWCDIKSLRDRVKKGIWKIIPLKIIYFIYRIDSATKRDLRKTIVDNFNKNSYQFWDIL